MNKIITIFLIIIVHVIITGCSQSKTKVYDKQINEININNQNNEHFDESNTPNQIYVNDIENEKKIIYSKTAGYKAQELIRIDFKAKTHAQVQDINEYRLMSP